MKELFKRLNLKVDVENKFWKTAYKKAVLEPDIPFFITQDFVKNIQEKYSVLPKNYGILLSAIKQIQCNADLCLLSKILYHLLFLKIGKKRIFAGFELPKAPKGAENTLAYDLFSVFPIMAHIPKSFALLEQKGVEKEICSRSHCQLDTCISEASEKYNKPCFTTEFFMCYRAFIYLNVLRIGRFRFEVIKKSNLNAYAFINNLGEVKILMHGITLNKNGNVLGNPGCLDEQGSFVAKVYQDDNYFYGHSIDESTCLVDNNSIKLDKKDWQIIYQPNDAIIEVHIPFDESFDDEYCQKSYEKAREVFKKCYPEYEFKCFATSTWFFAPVLQKVLKQSSNIYKFRQKYNRFPAKCSGLDVFNYVYKINPKAYAEVNFDGLAEDNSLKKGLKEQLKKGEFVYEFSGLFKF